MLDGHRPDPSVPSPALPGAWRRAWSVCGAELRRHVLMSPFSFLFSTLLFPFLTVSTIYLLPKAHIGGWGSLRQGAIRIEVDGRPVETPPAFVEEWISSINNISIYHFVIDPNALERFQAGIYDIALGLQVRSRAELSSGARRGAAVAKDAGAVLSVYRRDDFLSSLFLAKLRAWGKESARGDGGHPRVKPAVGSGPRQTRGSVERLKDIAPFVLIGFAWFFVTAGAIEAFVIEREKRTMELLLATALEAEDIVRGRLAFILLQAAGPQLTAAFALLLAGFSPYLLLFSGLLVLGMIVLSVASFRFTRDSVGAARAGWKTGLIFMLSFPVLIVVDDLSGTLSPFYHLGKAFDGPPPLLPYCAAYIVFGVSAVWSMRMIPALARRWRL